MPYTIDWYIENEIAYIHYFGVLTADELRDSLAEGIDYVDRSPRSLVHGILDVGDLTKPVPVTDVLQISREVGSHERLGWHITLRENSILVKMGIAFGTTLFKMRTRSFDHMDEVIAFLKTVDGDLHWDNVNPSLLIK